MMRQIDYARTTPEPRKGSLVFVVIFVVVIIAGGP
jgi:hypothetical protein